MDSALKILVEQYRKDIVPLPAETPLQTIQRAERLRYAIPNIFSEINRRLDELDGSGASGQIYNEIPLGVMDGVNKTFTTQNTFTPTSTRVYKNMLRLTLNGDYTETGPNQITISCILRSTDTLIIDYSLESTIIT